MNVKSVTEVDDAVVARVSDVLEFAFPGQKFNVLKVCDSGVYNMINVSWLDGAYFHERRSLNNFHRDRVITFEQIAE